MECEHLLNSGGLPGSLKRWRWQVAHLLGAADDLRNRRNGDEFIRPLPDQSQFENLARKAVTIRRSALPPGLRLRAISSSSKAAIFLSTSVCRATRVNGHLARCIADMLVSFAAPIDSCHDSLSISSATTCGLVATTISRAAECECPTLRRHVETPTYGLPRTMFQRGTPFSFNCADVAGPTAVTK